MFNLVEENHAILQQVMPEVDFVRQQVTGLDEIAEEMIETMKANDGIGLAAPQIGLRVRMFVMRKDNGEYIACINPSFDPVNDETAMMKEGCLSFPELFLNVKRPKTINATYYTTTGSKVEEVLTNLEGRCFQHELDHLDGVTFVKKVSKLSLQMAKKRRRRNLKRGK